MHAYADFGSYTHMKFNKVYLSLNQSTTFLDMNLNERCLEQMENKKG